MDWQRWKSKGPEFQYELADCNSDPTVKNKVTSRYQILKLKINQSLNHFLGYIYIKDVLEELNFKLSNRNVSVDYLQECTIQFYSEFKKESLLPYPGWKKINK